MCYDATTTRLIVEELSPWEQMEVAVVAADIAEMRRQRPTARFPEPVIVWLLWPLGIQWDPAAEAWIPAGRGLGYLPGAYSAEEA